MLPIKGAKFSELTHNLAREKMHGYFITGYVFDVDTDLLLKPALLTKAVAGSPVQVDVSINALFKERFTLGVAYRWDAAVSGLAGFQIDKNWFIGYSYDAETTRMADYNSRNISEIRISVIQKA